MVIAALLVLGFVFAASWITLYVDPGHDPRVLFPWFGLAAAAIVVLGVLIGMRRGRGGSG
jgi:hypothetical protein